MNSNKRICNCYDNNPSNKRKRSTNLDPRAVIDKENINPQRSCGCGCARKSNLECCKPRRHSDVISQCSVKINQVKATISANDGKIKLARAPFGDLKKKSSNIQCDSKTITQNLYSNTNKSAGVATSTKIYSKSKNNSTSATSSVAAIEKEIRKCNIPLPHFSKFQQKPIQIPSKKEIKKTVNLHDTRSFGYVSAISDMSLHSSHENSETWHSTDEIFQFSYTLEKSEICIDGDSDLVLDDEPTSIIFDGIPPLRKKTLENHVNVSSRFKGVINLDPYANKVHPSILYTKYMIDSIENILVKEEKLKINKDLMILSNIHPTYRTAVINWLVKLHKYYNSDASVFYICIRLFDKLLASIEIPQKLLQLTGMVTYWIAKKYCDHIGYQVSATQLQELCCDRYSAKFITTYERKILSLLNYDICIEEPIIFIHYYIFLLKIEDSNDMSFCANYLLDCLATSSDINTFPLSLQASAAVYLSLQFLGSTLNIWKTLEPYPGFYTHENLYCVTEKIIERMLLIQNENYEFREVFVKYACEAYNYISVRVCEGLKSMK